MDIPDTTIFALLTEFERLVKAGLPPPMSTSSACSCRKEPSARNDEQLSWHCSLRLLLLMQLLRGGHCGWRDLHMPPRLPPAHMRKWRGRLRQTAPTAVLTPYGTARIRRRCGGTSVSGAVALVTTATATNSKPEEKISGDFKNAGVVTPPHLRRAMVRLVRVSNLELVDISSFGGRCYLTLHASAVQRSVRAVRRGVLDIADSVAEADKVVVLTYLDELDRDALSPTENNKCSTPEEVLRSAGQKRLRCLSMLSSRIPSRNLPEYAKQA